MGSGDGRRCFALIVVAFLLAASTAGAAEYCATYGPHSPDPLPSLLVDHDTWAG